MSEPFFSVEEIRNFTRIPNSLKDREQVDSILYNIMVGIQQLVLLSGGESALNSEISGAVLNNDERFTRLVCELEENNKLLCEIRTLLQGMYT